MKLVVVAAALALASPASYLQSQQRADGGWGDPPLTAWAALGLRASGADTGGALDYLSAHDGQLTKPTDVALVALAEAALGHETGSLLARLVKLAALRWASENGVTSVWTTNDETNAPMLAVNRRLGYEPRLRRVEYLREAETAS